ncbi:serine/threonine-protein kinase [Candidatus Uabimicrobium amorphum]|uniref:serine/threonine-protein kinase n=1 Tax=Uabimicrobium amorphum TaxID=2596890 RepID=UPI001E5D8C7C|nr:serine/threonine-protein kinase [Candidatus Uabimicrobium amorphum]
MSTSIVGTTFDDYTVKKLLGKGNMAEVYLAHQNSLQRDVALKILRRTNNLESDDSIGRFLREARLAASIQHPNIVNIYSIGNKEAFCYIAMEYVCGYPLEDIIEKGPLEEEDTWLIALQVADALKCALVKDIIHRDIKPANILMTENQAKVTDFGLSKRKNDQELTQAGLILGTPSYMSIEQATGGDVDHRSDIYSLGATLYKTITGRLLFTANSVIDVLYKHRYEKTVDPIEYVPSLSYKSSFIIAKMIQKDPNERYQSYDELLCDVHCLLDEKPLIYANEKCAHNIYFDKPIERKVFSKTSRLTQRIVGNVQNIIKRDETSESSKMQATLGIHKNPLSETHKRRREVTSEQTAIRRRTKTTRKISASNLLQKNIEFLEQKVKKSFSEHLVKRGIITSGQLKSALEIYLTVNSKFGELAVSEGWLLPDQVEKILKVQKRIKKSFGQLAIQMGFLRKEQVLEILSRQDKHHIDFYEVLLREKIIKREVLEQELIVFSKSRP